MDCSSGVNFELKETLDSLGSQLLSYLLFENRGDGFWWYSKNDNLHRKKIKFLASQIIEIITWLDLQEELFPNVKQLFDYLDDNIRVFEKDGMEFIPTRYKSLLQYKSVCFPELDHKLNETIVEIINHSWSEFLTTEKYFLPLKGLWNYLDAVTLFGNNQIIDDNQSQVFNEMKNNLNLKIDDLINSENIKLNKDYKKLSYFLSLKLGFWGPESLINYDDQEDKILLDEIKSWFEKEFDSLITRKNSDFHLNVNYLLHTAIFLIQSGLRIDDEFFSWLIRYSIYLKEKPTPDLYKLCLILKVLIVKEKDKIKSKFLRIVLDTYTKKIYGDTEESKNIDLFSNIINNSIEVEIIKPMKKLTGGWSSAQVWRVHGKYKLPFSGKSRNEFSYLIKIGPKMNFTRAAKIYRDLDPTAREMFPEHQKTAELVNTKEGVKYFILMEELENYYPLGLLLLERYPKHPSKSVNCLKILGLVKNGLQTITKLHYLDRKANCVDRSDWAKKLVLPVKTNLFTKYSDVFEWAEIVFNKNDNSILNLIENKIVVSYDNIEYEYENITGINDFFTKLLETVKKINEDSPKEVFPSIVHGDCHSNNIMSIYPFTSEAEILKFIDIDALHYGDYLSDYSDFAAHVCFTLLMESELYTDEVFQYNERPLGETEDKTKITFQFSPENSSDSPRLYFPEILTDVFQEILCHIKKSNEKYEQSGFDKKFYFRFLLLLGLRLMFISAKSVYRNKTFVLFIQALSILNYVQKIVDNHNYNGDDTIPLSPIRLNPRFYGILLGLEDK